MKLFALINEEKPRRTIIITESQVWDLLLEAATIQDIYQKYYTQIPQEIFQQIVSADPTYNPQKPNKMGKYAKWLLAIYQKGNLKTEDLYKATEYLQTFIKFNGKIEQKDIMKYKSLQDVYNVIQPFLQNPQQAATKAEEVRQIKEGAEKVYEDEKWLVIVPHTKEASCYYGKGTQWCTAADNANNYFNVYYSHGLLYINILKGTNTKYQFHFETNSFMDATDRRIQQPIQQTIGMTENLVNFYVQKYGRDAILPLKTDIDPDDLIQPDDLNDYYLNEEQTMLYKFNDETLNLDLIIDIREKEDCFSTRTIQNRYILLYDGPNYTDMYDLELDEFIFGGEASRISIFNNDYIIAYFTDENDKGTQDIFSLKKGSFVLKNLDADAYVKKLGDECQYNYLKRCKRELTCYTNDIVLIIGYDEKTGNHNSVIPFSLSKGKALTNDVYKTFETQQIYYGRYPVTFQSLWRGKDRQSADALLFDGTLVPLPQFEAQSDQIIPQHLADSNN